MLDNAHNTDLVVYGDLETLGQVADEIDHRKPYRKA